MIVLLADSGSSKTDWVVLKGSKELLRLQTMGFNPYFQSQSQIQDELLRSLIPSLSLLNEKINCVRYYGSGCSTPQNCTIVSSAIKETTGVRDVLVEHDLLAAARALCGRNPGIAAILGTGSNSCLYDGVKILENVPSVGYLWSDYGGGSQIGKFMIRDYFEGEMPDDLKSLFESEGYNRETILENVYKATVPSKYLASISHFTFKFKSHPHVKKVLDECFDSFFKHQISKYTNSRSYKINTVGSVGYYYRSELEKCSIKHGYELGTVLKSPIEGLIHYHSS